MEYRDLVKQTTTTTGTGTYALSSLASAGCFAFGDSFSDGASVPYCATDGTDSEVGVGTYNATANTLSRDTILRSTNSNAPVNWGAGSKDIFCVQPAASVTQEPQIAALRNGLLLLLDGSVDESGNPIDKTGCFSGSAVGGLAQTVLTDGPWSGRTAFALNGTDAAVEYDAEELRICGAISFAFIGRLDAASSPTTDYALVACTASGETLATNELILIKHSGSYSGAWFTFQEYSSGSNSEGVQKPSAPVKDRWYYVCFSRDVTGKQWDISCWDEIDGWTHSCILHATAPAKNTTENQQLLQIFNETAASRYYHGVCAGVAMFNRTLSRAERMALKDLFFRI